MGGEGGKGQGCWHWLGGGPGCRAERPERQAETLLRLLEEPPPLSRLSPPPLVPPLPKPRKAVQVSSCAFTFPSRCPPQDPRAALSPPSLAMATLRVHPEAQAKVSVAGSSGEEKL